MSKKVPIGICPEISLSLRYKYGTVINCLRPIVLPNRVVGAVYHLFSGKWFASTLWTCTSSLTACSWYDDEALSHFPCIVRQCLNQTFGEQWIGSEGWVNWPAWFPDLNPLDFWLWESLTTLDCWAPVNNLEDTVLKCMGTTESICCRDHMNISHISTGTGFWT
jgi:hypothetical protein